MEESLEAVVVKDSQPTRDHSIRIQGPSALELQAHGNVQQMTTFGSAQTHRLKGSY